MRRILLALGALIVLTGAALAQDDAASRGIEEVITSQIEAFRADDVDGAFAYASPAIQGLFGSPQRFGQMVQQGYPMVRRPAEVTFLDLEADGRAMRQRVMIRDAAGTIHLLEYEMMDFDGRWRIDGVRLLEAEQIGV